MDSKGPYETRRDRIRAALKLFLINLLNAAILLFGLSLTASDVAVLSGLINSGVILFFYIYE